VESSGRFLLGRAHDVTFSYSRHRANLEKLAKAAGATGHVGTPAEAVAGADIILLAVHWTRVDDVLAQAGELSRKTLITCSLPMSADDSHMVIGHTRSGAEALADKVPKANVVSAFSTVPSEVLFAVFENRGKRTLADLVYCGDHKAAKNTASHLIRDTGFNPLDLGPLSMARLTEPFSLLTAQLAYSDSENPALAYRFERFLTNVK
jgi:predicted dinucleotide-binding enzyme